MLNSIAEISKLSSSKFLSLVYLSLDMAWHTGLSPFICISLFSNQVTGKQPNIVFLLADDFGYNDVGYHNPDMFTPYIDLMASQGVILEQSYVQPMCTPSR